MDGRQWTNARQAARTETDREAGNAPISDAGDTLITEHDLVALNVNQPTPGGWLQTNQLTRIGWSPRKRLVVDLSAVVLPTVKLFRVGCGVRCSGVTRHLVHIVGCCLCMM